MIFDLTVSTKKTVFFFCVRPYYIKGNTIVSIGREREERIF